MKVLITGAGFSGLFTAYELWKRGVREIVVVDEKYPGYGGSFRNIGCFRSSFTSPEHVILMKKSIEMWLNTVSELGFEIYQKGYLWIARREETVDYFKKLVSFHNEYDVPTRVIDPDEALNIQPGLNKKIIKGAMFDPTAGKMPVFENFVKLYLKLKKLGVLFKTYTKIRGLKASGSRIVEAESDRGVLKADVFIITAGGRGTREILRSIDVELPVVDETRHPVATEQYGEVIKPALVIDWDTPGAPYVTQTKLGTMIFARSIRDENEVSVDSHRVDAISKTVKPIVELIPLLRNINIVRYWIGYYEMTPDHHPVYGPIPHFENLYIAAGFSGHGLMMAPVTGLLTADWVLDGRPSIEIARNLTIERFQTGRLIKEIAIIG